MKIRTRFLLISLASVAILAAGCVFLILGVNDSNETLHKSAALGEVVERLHVLRALTLEYLQSPTERRKTQWYAEYRAIGAVTPAIDQFTPDVKRIFVNARPIFDLIVADTPAPSQRGAAVIPEEGYRRQLSSSLLTDTQRVIDWARDLSQREQEHLISAIRFYSLGVFILLISTFVLTALVVVPSGLYIIRSIATMQRGTNAVSDGRLDHRIDVRGRDEFGELARDFNAMTARLQSLYEELEARYEELRKVDVIKDELIYHVTHELKTPVAKQMMQIEIIRAALGEPVPAKVEAALRVMEGSAHRQQRVIKDMLSLGRLESGRKGFTVGPVRIDELIRRVFEDYRSTLDAKDAELALSLEPLTVRGNEEMLWHVFSNLLNNAIKFRKPGRPCRVDIAAAATPQEVVVKVCDNGIGIGDGDLPRVFERFYQATPSTEGSGVGLSICKIIVEEMGGTITLTSAGPDRGASAVITLPRG